MDVSTSLKGGCPGLRNIEKSLKGGCLINELEKKNELDVEKRLKNECRVALVCFSRYI